MFCSLVLVVLSHGAAQLPTLRFLIGTCRPRRRQARPSQRIRMWHAGCSL